MKNQERKINFNQNWKFLLSEKSDILTGNDQAQNWRDLSLPHDWSIEQAYDQVHGDGATAYLTGGIGWYQKNFKLKNRKNKTVYLLFDGIYNHSQLWINQQPVGCHVYGYSPFYFDITAFLNQQQTENQILIKVDRSRYIDSRWYTGSGIYRDVELYMVNDLHFPIWATAITILKADRAAALINMQVKVKNNNPCPQIFSIRTVIYNQKHKQVAEFFLPASAEAKSEQSFTFDMTINEPDLWDIDCPCLYRAVQALIVDGEIVDQNEIRFGIRTFYFDPEKGFFLNGRNLKIKGVCLHHTAGLVGAAVPPDVWKRQLQTLKKGGCNAIRMAHNPASNQLLDLCDELGFLVQDEFFDEWHYPKDKRLNMQEQHADELSRGYALHFRLRAEQDLKNTVLSHRHHPCIFQWSIGNEIEWTYPGNREASGYFSAHSNGNYFWNPPPHSIQEIQKRLRSQPGSQFNISQTARQLVRWTRELDQSRPIIANCILPSVSFESGYIDALDIAGFSYRRVMYDYARKNYPRKICMGTESLGQWHEWKAVLERDYIPGTFIWTGIDYLGEAHGKEWPQKGLACGLLDLAGFKKPAYHLFKSLWNEQPHLYLAVQTEELSRFQRSAQGGIKEKNAGSWQQLLWDWPDVHSHWNFSRGSMLIVEAYSNCSQVELFLNGQSLGLKRLADFEDHIYKWAVPFQKGELKAVGRKDEAAIVYRLLSAEKPAALDLELDKSEITANGRDCVHVTVQLLDEKGCPVQQEERPVIFEIEGECTNLGVDNGSIKNIQAHKTDRLQTYQGKALMILQAKRKKGLVKVRAKSGVIKSKVKVFRIY